MILDRPEKFQKFLPVFRQLLNKRGPYGIKFRDLSLKRDLEQDADIMGFKVKMGPQVVGLRPVDHNAVGDFEFSNGFNGQLKVIHAEGSGLRDQNAKVAPFDGGNHGAGSARRRIDDRHAVWIDMRPDLPDERRSHGFANGEFSLDERNALSLTQLDLSDRTVGLPDGSLGAEARASPAAVAHLRKEKNFFGKEREGVVGANVPANTAKITLGMIDLGDPDGCGFPLADRGLQEYLGVGFFHIAIQELGLSQGQRQIDRDRGFPCAAFAACYRNDHFGFVAMRV